MSSGLSPPRRSTSLSWRGDLSLEELSLELSELKMAQRLHQIAFVVGPNGGAIHDVRVLPRIESTPALCHYILSSGQHMIKPSSSQFYRELTVGSTARRESERLQDKLERLIDPRSMHNKQLGLVADVLVTLSSSLEANVFWSFQVPRQLAEAAVRYFVVARQPPPLRPVVNRRLRFEEFGHEVFSTLNPVTSRLPVFFWRADEAPFLCMSVKTPRQQLFVWFAVSPRLEHTCLSSEVLLELGATGRQTVHGMGVTMELLSGVPGNASEQRLPYHVCVLPLETWRGVGEGSSMNLLGADFLGMFSFHMSHERGVLFDIDTTKLRSTVSRAEAKEENTQGGL